MERRVEIMVIDELRHEWGDSDGFFFQYREGRFCEEGFQRVKKLLHLIDYKDGERLPKELVSLIFDIPFFLECNRSGFKFENEQLCNKAIVDFSNILFSRLGK